MAKKGEKDFKYKYIRPDELRDLEKSSTADLLKAHVAENKNLKAAKKMKKEDPQLQSLSAEIKKHREENMPDEVKTLLSRIKELKSEVDEEIQESLKDKRDLNKGFNDTIKAFAEKVEVILAILAKRNQ